MSTVFEWKPNYSVKVEAMDKQHKKLFELVNELSEAMRVGKGKHVAGEVLNRLVDYTVQHFSAEEKLMEKHKYAAFSTHRIEHRHLTDKVLAFKKDFDAGNSSITPELLTFLQQWLTNHIQVVDRGYSEFLNSNGVH
ncbi:MAG TPA: bacteriohemerythrin [Candidatus Sulfotelmatobacter sp.]|nr:bacteriohemerythrin [Candidatus Sulfotelmatobacter sp.]